MNNIMLDLETLGKGSNAVIIAIGAVQFDQTGLGQTFYTAVDPQSCVDIGMKVDVSTVMWWMGQNQTAREAFMGAGTPIVTALRSFSDYVKDCAGDRAEVWGNDSTFDNTILGNAYIAAGVVQPWPYWGNRCYRTIKNLYPHVPFDFGRVGTAHNALDDAVTQATHASGILAHIEEARVSHGRYETSRRMNPMQWADAWKLHITTGKPFDEIVDDMRPFMFPNKEQG
jgi:hypothetical protein